jgi:Domain of unknown function (DUF4062)
MAKKRYQVFVSSTYLDLIEERRCVTEALYQANYIPVGMEMFPSTTNSSIKIIETLIKESDYYVLIIGSRYGSMYPTKQISFTEHEYNFANRHKKGPIVFIHERGGKQIPQESEAMVAKLNTFKNRVKRLRTVSFSDNPDRLARNIITALNLDDERASRSGWIRADSDNVLLVMPDEHRRALFYRDLRDRATKTIFIMGAGLSQVSMDKETLISQLSRGVNIRLLGIDPEFCNDPRNRSLIDAFFSESMITATEASFSKRVSDAAGKISLLIAYISTLGLRGKLEYRTFSFVPTTNFTVVDEGTKQSSLVYEHILPENRRVLFHDIGSENFAYKKILPDHEKYWNEAKSIGASK